MEEQVSTSSKSLSSIEKQPPQPADSESNNPQEKQNTKKRSPRSPHTASTSISIKGFTQAKDSEQNVEEAGIDRSHYGSRSFTEKEFMEAWKKLVTKVANSTEKANSMLHASLTVNAPQLQEDNKILVKLENKSQHAEMLERRVELHDFLRKELQNGSLEILMEINKKKKEKKAYTQEEKFKAMVEKNPLLLKLKTRFDLDLI